MLVVYLRSSSLGSYSICEHSYYLSYCLGMQTGSGRKAVLGNIVHKALECLARKKLALQNGEKEFFEEEGKGRFDTSEFTPEDAIKYSFDLYDKKEPQHEFEAADFRKCRKWMLQTMGLNSGLWNPLNRDVVLPEQYFDIPIDRPWALYDYELPDGSRLKGRLAIKGTVDLITRLDSQTIEYLDWKTGKRKDWATEKVKDWKALRKDPQLRMYYYALRKLYPQYPYVIMSIVFTQDGGGFSMDYDDSDVVATEEMLRERFETIRDCKLPARRLDHPDKSWWCEKLCQYHSDTYKTEEGDTGVSVCEYIHQEIISLGIDRVTSKYVNLSTLGKYGDGGGKSSCDTTNNPPTG
jgi:hypothetical protein